MQAPVGLTWEDNPTSSHNPSLGKHGSTAVIACRAGCRPWVRDAKRIAVHVHSAPRQ